MDMEDQQEQPLMLCMENTSGEEVMLTIDPRDDFQTFLDKAKSVLGYDIDLTSVTKNQIVELHDNAYQFLINLDLNESGLGQTFDENLDNDEVYVLDDGTQIRASQIHFDNEDDPLDITLEKLPFVKLNNEQEEKETTDTKFDDVDYKIVASPVPTVSSSPKHGFINSVPFKLVCNNTVGFEAQFTKYLEQSTKTYATLNNVTKKNKSPRSLIKDNFNDKDEFMYTREEVLNMLKDSPVTSIPYEVTEKKHVRKTDPTRMVQKCASKVVDIEGLVVADRGNKNCFICGLSVTDKVYIFDKEDQKIHRCSPQKKMSTQLKIICESCLTDNFMPSRMKGPNQYLNSDEYLVIRDNQQYIFQKTKHFKFKNDERDMNKLKKDEFVKVEIGSDGEIVTKPIDNDDVLIVNERKDSSSDIEIVEGVQEIDKIIDNLDDADEDVKVYLGKYEEGSDFRELKCRFCERQFTEIVEVIDHCDSHKHDLEDDVVYPCPLCDYGYPTHQWLKGHIRAAHEKSEPTQDISPNKESTANIQNRTSSNSENQGHTSNESQETIKTESNNTSTSQDMVIKTEVKQESVSSDDEIWIVQTNDDEASGQLKKILRAANVEKPDEKSKKNHKCFGCSQIFPSAETLTSHKCRRRGRKRKSDNEDDFICIPTEEDFIRRAQGRPRQVDAISEQSGQKIRKYSKETSEAQIVTCHNCNQSFTSKVRLKFHMQFHDKSSLLRSDGTYACTSCCDVFASEAQLFDHVHFQHDKRKRWQCPVHGCEKTFYLRATLTKHSRTHTDTRRYVCVTCGKRFLDKQTLDEHGVTHLQIKPYQCHICLKQLTRVSRLRMHVRAHHAPRAPQPVRACAACYRAFPDLPHAQEHANKSTECIEAFASELKEEVDTTVQLSPTSGLVRHTVQVIESPGPPKRIKRQVPSPVAEPMLAKLTDEAKSIIRVVEIDKAFRCEYCEDVFYIEDGLNKHRVIHKGVKNPFTCHICKVSFATYSRCTTHKTTHGFYKRPASTANDPTSGVVGYGDFPTVKHFLCEDCGRSYLHWTYLQVHRRMKHPNENFLHKCNQCEMTFPNSWSLAYHRKKLHTKPQDETANKTTIQNYRIPCRDCDEILPNKSALYKHRKKEHSGVSMASTNVNTSLCTASQDSSAQNRAFWARRCAPRPSTTVIEISGVNPSTEDIMNLIDKNNIQTDKIIQVTTMSFAKGTSSIVPNSARALSMLCAAPKALVYVRTADGPPFGMPTNDASTSSQPTIHAPRRPIILQRNEGGLPTTDSNQRLPDLNVQMLLQNNAIMQGNQIMQMQLNDTNTTK